jgi:uncharacterized protein YggU (UPF0235/DUF167 family)
MAGRIRTGGGVLSFHLRLTPKGGRDAIDGWTHGADGQEYLKARVAAVAEDGKANAALIALLAKTLAVAKSTIRIAGGHGARLKRIEISPASAATAARLAAMETAR